MSDKLTKYGNPQYPPLEKQETARLVTPRKEYQAFIKMKGSEHGESFRIHDRHGNFDFYYYSHLIEGSFRDGELTLTLTSRVYTLTGTNIERLAELFCEKKVKSVFEFNPDTHEPPDDPQATIIETIDRVE